MIIYPFIVSFPSFQRVLAFPVVPFTLISFDRCSPAVFFFRFFLFPAPSSFLSSCFVGVWFISALLCTPLPDVMVQPIVTGFFFLYLLFPAWSVVSSFFCCRSIFYFPWLPSVVFFSSIPPLFPDRRPKARIARLCVYQHANFFEVPVFFFRTHLIADVKDSCSFFSMSRNVDPCFVSTFVLPRILHRSTSLSPTIVMHARWPFSRDACEPTAIGPTPATRLVYLPPFRRLVSLPADTKMPTIVVTKRLQSCFCG